ncbi:MAG TPA: TetR family transcriptional regulator [Solirubrobacterales bacterium]|nr:TetR family transcriptional regulator [Solirubrobacterales bacterium]
MVTTPWGDASTLRDRRLSPGRGTPREEVCQNQRERLFAAMVAVTAEKGYAETSVADLVELSGVSSRSFYQHFADKEECFLAAMDEILGGVQGRTTVALQGDGDQRKRVEDTGKKLIETLALQPAAARLWLVESFCAGERAQARMNQALDGFAPLLQAVLDQIPERRGMPPQLTEALLGGVSGVIYGRLANGKVDSVRRLAPALSEWALSIPPPPHALRSPDRRKRIPGTNPPPFAAHVPGERILRGFTSVVAEKGYAAATIADTAAAASISQNTFYAHFRDKEDALHAALDSSGAQLVAATLPAVRRAPPWPAALRVALEAAFGFLAAEPEFAHLRAVEVYAIGPEAVELRNRQGGEIVQVLRSMAADAPTEIAPIPLEATLAAVNSLLYQWVRHEGARRLPELVPLATYLVLAPLIGAEEAHETACG